MLPLNYVVISSKELSRAERIHFACRGEDFGAILSNGVLKVNKELKKPKKLEKLIRKMFEVDHLLSAEDDQLFDLLYNEICATWGDELWGQINRAWSETLHAKLDAEYKREATAWLERYGNVSYTDTLDDLMPDFRNGVMEAIYSASRDVRDIFNYGFQMGAKYGAKEAAEA